MKTFSINCICRDNAGYPTLRFFRKTERMKPIMTDYDHLGSMNPINIKNVMCDQIRCYRRLNGFKELQGRLEKHKFEQIFYLNQYVDSPEDCKEKCENQKNRCFLDTYSYRTKNCYLYNENDSKNLLRHDINYDYVSYRKRK